VRITI